jgi:adenylyltransferase/sulfurtransferase
VQAAEVLKLILHTGSPLIGKFFIYDCLDPEFSIFTLKKNPSCPLCGQDPVITDLSGSYSESCTLPRTPR